MRPEPIGWQVILRLDDDRVLAASPAERRAVAGAIAALGEAFGVYAWCVADNHLHIALLAPLATAAELGRRLRVALWRRLRPGAPFQPTRLRAINDQAHARSLLAYVLGQSAHHGAVQDRWHEGNCVHDLLGARVGAPWLARRVQERLPRVTRADLLAPIGVADFAEHDGLDPDAVAATFALADLSGKTPLAVAARRAAVHAARDRPSAELAVALGIDERTVRAARAGAVPVAHLRSLRRQLGLRVALAELPGGLADDGPVTRVGGAPRDTTLRA